MTTMTAAESVRGVRVILRVEYRGEIIREVVVVKFSGIEFEHEAGLLACAAVAENAYPGAKVQWVELESGRWSVWGGAADEAGNVLFVHDHHFEDRTFRDGVCDWM